MIAVVSVSHSTVGSSGAYIQGSLVQYGSSGCGGCAYQLTILVNPNESYGVSYVNGGAASLSSWIETTIQ